MSAPWSKHDDSLFCFLPDLFTTFLVISSSHGLSIRTLDAAGGTYKDYFKDYVEENVFDKTYTKKGGDTGGKRLGSAKCCHCLLSLRWGQSPLMRSCALNNAAAIMEGLAPKVLKKFLAPSFLLAGTVPYLPLLVGVVFALLATTAIVVSKTS